MKEKNIDKLELIDEVINYCLDMGYLTMKCLNERGNVIYDITPRGEEYLERQKTRG